MSEEIDRSTRNDGDPEFKALYVRLLDAFTKHHAPSMTVAARRLFAAGVRVTKVAPEPTGPESADVPLFDLEEAGA